MLFGHAPVWPICGRWRRQTVDHCAGEDSQISRATLIARRHQLSVELIERPGRWIFVVYNYEGWISDFHHILRYGNPCQNPAVQVDLSYATKLSVVVSENQRTISNAYCN